MLLNVIAELHLLYSMHSLLQDLRWYTCNKLVHFSMWPTAHQQWVLKFYTLHSHEQKICEKKLCIATNSTLNGVIAIINCSKPLLLLATLFMNMDISAEYTWAQITMKSVTSELLGVIDFVLSVFASVSMCLRQALDIVSMPYSSHTLPLVSYASHIILRWRHGIFTIGPEY
jgi:hypothetical protein